MIAGGNVAKTKKKVRGRGRPAIDPSERLSKMVILRLTETEHAALEERAQRERRSLANALRVYLIDRGFFRRSKR